MKRRRKRNPDLLVIGNPVGRGGQAAAEAYKRFHGRAPDRVRNLGGKGPALVALGDLVEVVYRPTRGARRGAAYVHKFGAGAVLAATPDGRELVIVPGRARPFVVDWEQGIVG